MVNKLPKPILNAWLAAALAAAVAVLLTPVALFSIFALMLGCAPDGLEIVPGSALAWACGDAKGPLGMVALAGPVAALVAGVIGAARRRSWALLLLAFAVAAALAATPAAIMLLVPDAVR